jgi:hypothetical protein
MRAALVIVMQTGGFSVCAGVEIPVLHALNFFDRSVELAKYPKL